MLVNLVMDDIKEEKTTSRKANRRKWHGIRNFPVIREELNKESTLDGM